MDTQENVASCINACVFLKFSYTQTGKNVAYLLLSVLCHIHLFTLTSVIQYSCNRS